MPPDPDQGFARFLHRHTKERGPGEAFAPPITHGLGLRPSRRDRSRPSIRAMVQSDLVGPRGRPRGSRGSSHASLFRREWPPPPPSSTPCCGPGDRVLIPADAYYTTRVFADRYLAPFGIEVEKVPTLRIQDHDLAGFKLVWIETPSNPRLDLVDIELMAGRAAAAGAILVADNTTMTPLGQRPLDLGADIVVSSDTKAMNGHSDVVSGHVASRRADLIDEIRQWRNLAGAIPGPFEAWLVHRGLETLEIRFERMCANAASVAERLAGSSDGCERSIPGTARPSAARPRPQADDRVRIRSGVDVCQRGSWRSGSSLPVRLSGPRPASADCTPRPRGGQGGGRRCRPVSSAFPWGRSPPTSSCQRSTKPSDSREVGSRKTSKPEGGGRLATAAQPLLVRSLRMSSRTPETSVVSGEAWTPFRWRLASGSVSSSASSVP